MVGHKKQNWEVETLAKKKSKTQQNGNEGEGLQDQNTHLNNHDFSEKRRQESQQDDPNRGYGPWMMVQC